MTNFRRKTMLKLRNFCKISQLSRNYSISSINHAQGRPSPVNPTLDRLELAKLDLARSNFTRLYQAYLIKSDDLTWDTPESVPNIYTTERNFRTRSADQVRRIWAEFVTTEKYEFLSYGELEFLENKQLPAAFRGKVFDYERRNEAKRGDERLQHSRYTHFVRTYTLDDFIRGEDFLASHADRETRAALARAKNIYRSIVLSWCRDEICENPAVDYKFGKRKFDNFLERHWRKLDNKSKSELYNMGFTCAFDGIEYAGDELHWRKSNIIISEGVLKSIRDIRLDHAYLGFRKYYNFHNKKLQNDKRGGIEKTFNALNDDDKLVFVEFSRTTRTTEAMEKIFYDKYIPIMDKRVEDYYAKVQAKKDRSKKTSKKLKIAKEKEELNSN